MAAKFLKQIRCILAVCLITFGLITIIGTGGDNGTDSMDSNNGPAETTLEYPEKESTPADSDLNTFYPPDKKGPYKWETVSMDESNTHIDGVLNYTIRYPISDLPKQYPAIVLQHGWIASEKHFSELAEQFASHGFIVLGVTNLTGSETTDQTSLISLIMGLLVEFYADAFLNSVDMLRSTTTDENNPLYSLVDTTRIAITGHSMGGFGTILSMNRDSTSNNFIKCGIAMNPACILSCGSDIDSPVMLFACEEDPVVKPEKVSSIYENIPETTTKLYLSFSGLMHSSVQNIADNAQEPKAPEKFWTMMVSWMKYYLEDDTRYGKYLDDDSETHQNYIEENWFTDYQYNKP